MDENLSLIVERLKEHTEITLGLRGSSIPDIFISGQDLIDLGIVTKAQLEAVINRRNAGQIT
jgi:hypothetical protein